MCFARVFVPVPTPGCTPAPVSIFAKKSDQVVSISWDRVSFANGNRRLTFASRGIMHPSAAGNKDEIMNVKYIAELSPRLRVDGVCRYFLSNSVLILQAPASCMTFLERLEQKR
jgi:hypothetical protein